MSIFGWIFRGYGNEKFSARKQILGRYNFSRECIPTQKKNLQKISVHIEKYLVWLENVLSKDSLKIDVPKQLS